MADDAGKFVVHIGASLTAADRRTVQQMLADEVARNRAAPLAGPVPAPPPMCEYAPRVTLNDLWATRPGIRETRLD